MVGGGHPYSPAEPVETRGWEEQADDLIKKAGAGLFATYLRLDSNGLPDPYRDNGTPNHCLSYL